MLNIDLISDDEYFVELDIENIKPYYLISNYGRIYTKQRGGKLLTPFTDKDGYKRLELATYPKAKKYYVHRLVALAFIPNLNNLPKVKTPLPLGLGVSEWVLFIVQLR